MIENIEGLQRFESQLPELKAEYRKRMEEFLQIPEAHRKKRETALRAVHAAGLDYFNAIERVISLGTLCGAAKNPTWYTDKAETSANALHTIKEHYHTVNEKANALGIRTEPLKPARTAYANMQRLVKRTSPDLARELRDEFIRAGLPTFGFDRDESARVVPWEKVFAAISGSVFVIVILILALFIPEPTEFQVFVFRIVLALAAGAFATVISGFLHVEATLWRLGVRAGSGLALFVIIYAVNPPALIVKGPSDQRVVDNQPGEVVWPDRKDNEESLDKRPVEFGQVEIVPQPVNRITVENEEGQAHTFAGPEHATVRFPLRNLGSEAVHLERAEFLVEQVAAPELGCTASTLLFIPLIDHTDHIEVAMKKPAVGDSIPVPLQVTIEPQMTRDITLWFKSKHAAPLFLNGRLRVHYSGGFETSDHFELELFPKAARDGV